MPASWTSSGPVVGYQGGLIRAMPDPGSSRLGKLLYHRPIRADVAGDIVAWSRAHGLDPHVNHLERFILQADDPNADDYSAFMGARAELVPDLATSINHPVTKVLAVGEPPVPTDIAPLARERFRGARGRHDQPPEVPRVRRAGGVKGACRPVAGAPSQGAARRDARDRRPVERLRDARRGGAWGGDAERAAGVRATARYIAPPLEDEGVARMIEMLVLARPAAAQANSKRLTEEADAARRRDAPTVGPAEAGRSQPEATTAADRAEAIAEASPPEPARRTA